MLKKGRVIPSAVILSIDEISLQERYIPFSVARFCWYTNSNSLDVHATNGSNIQQQSPDTVSFAQAGSCPHDNCPTMDHLTSQHTGRTVRHTRSVPCIPLRNNSAGGSTYDQHKVLCSGMPQYSPFFHCQGENNKNMNTPF